MFSGFSRIGVLTLILVPASLTFAQESANVEIAKRAKAATAFVEVNGSFKQGSAFCVHESGFFLTNHHVVAGAEQVKLVLNPGMKDKKVILAQVVRSDKNLDLALLRVKEKSSFAALPLGTSDGLLELSPVIAAGFPFGTALSLEKGEFPAVSVNLGRITSMRFKNGKLERIQMDAVVNPGNSGGPLLDTAGKVVGVVVSGVRGATVNFAIPVSHVHQFVAAPEVIVSAPAVSYADRYKAAEFKVRAITMVPSTETIQVELRLGPKDKERVYQMTPRNGGFVVTPELVLLPLGVRVALTFPEGRVEGYVQDQGITIGRENVRLADVRSLRFTAMPSASLADGKTISGAVTGLDELTVAPAAGKVHVKPTQCKELIVTPPANESRVDYSVIVRRGKQELARVQDIVAFKNAPGGIDLPVEGGKLEGLWILEKAEENGGFYPLGQEEGLLIEGKQITWVRKNGKSAPGLPKAPFTIDPAKKPMTMDLKVNNSTWLAIYKIEGNRLIIGTNCNDEKRPGEFTTRLFAGPERATFLRTYKRESRE